MECLDMNEERFLLMNYAVLAKNLKYVRTLMRLTQEEMANILGVSKIVIYKWEANRAKMPVDKVARLAEVVGAKNFSDFYTIDLSTMRLKIQDKIVVITPREKN